jgi:hypothetical protein
MRLALKYTAAALACLLCVSCTSSAVSEPQRAAESLVIVAARGIDAQIKAQEALGLAAPGSSTLFTLMASSGDMPAGVAVRIKSAVAPSAALVWDGTASFATGQFAPVVTQYEVSQNGSSVCVTLTPGSPSSFGEPVAGEHACSSW